MLKKYEKKFKKMYERIIIKDEKPSTVIRDYLPFFERKGISELRVICHLAELIERGERKSKIEKVVGG